MAGEKKFFDLNKDNKQDLNDVKDAIVTLLQIALKHPLFCLVFICVAIILQTRQNAAQVEAVLNIIVNNGTNLLTFVLIVFAFMFAGITLYRLTNKR